MVQLSHLHMTTRKTIALTRWTFVNKANVSTFNMLCHRFYSKEQASFNLIAAVTVHSDFGTQENKVCHCFHCFPSICNEVMGLDATILVFWMLNFKPAFSLSSSNLIKRLFSSCSLSVMRLVSSAYLRLLIFLPAILIPACGSSSPAFCMMYSAYTLSKQDDSIQLRCTPFPIWNQYSVLQF